MGITCKLKMGFSNKNAQLMAPGHQLLEKCVVEKNEYTYSYISEGDPESDDLIEISCLDENSQEVVLKLARLTTMRSGPRSWGRSSRAKARSAKLCLLPRRHRRRTSRHKMAMTSGSWSLTPR